MLISHIKFCSVPDFTWSTADDCTGSETLNRADRIAKPSAVSSRNASATDFPSGMNSMAACSADDKALDLGVFIAVTNVFIVDTVALAACSSTSTISTAAELSLCRIDVSFDSSLSYLRMATESATLTDLGFLRSTLNFWTQSTSITPSASSYPEIPSSGSSSVIPSRSGKSGKVSSMIVITLSNDSFHSSPLCWPCSAVTTSFSPVSMYPP